jgi:hypothetical protein
MVDRDTNCSRIMGYTMITISPLWSSSPYGGLNGWAEDDESKLDRDNLVHNVRSRLRYLTYYVSCRTLRIDYLTLSPPLYAYQSGTQWLGIQSPLGA